MRFYESDFDRFTTLLNKTIASTGMWEPPGMGLLYYICEPDYDSYRRMGMSL